MGEEMKTEGDRLDVYVGSDPTNDELPPDDLFGPADPPTIDAVAAVALPTRSAGRRCVRAIIWTTSRS